MLNSLVEKMWRIMWESRWESCEKVCTFLTYGRKYCEMLRKTFGFTRSFTWMCTCVSTELLFGFTGVWGLDLHIYTEPITITTNNIKGD